MKSEIVTLTKHEISTLKHALYCYREMVRTQERLALNETSDTAKRDADRFSKIIRFALTLDEKLTDMQNQ